ncbi:MAG: hypothetical protein KI789_00090 [Hoeflea sp.]|nr:hypothetical protein [Hoeflea sp.]
MGECRIPAEVAERTLNILRGALEAAVEGIVVFKADAWEELLPVPGSAREADADAVVPILTVVQGFEAIVGRPVEHEAPQWLDDLIDGRWFLTGEHCSGHVASLVNSKKCSRCGIHIDDLRSDDDHAPDRTL